MKLHTNSPRSLDIGLGDFPNGLFKKGIKRADRFITSSSTMVSLVFNGELLYARRYGDAAAPLAQSEFGTWRFNLRAKRSFAHGTSLAICPNVRFFSLGASKAKARRLSIGSSGIGKSNASRSVHQLDRSKTVTQSIRRRACFRSLGSWWPLTWSVL